MATIRAGNITKNSYIVFKDQLHRVTKASFYSPGKGSAFMKTRLKSLTTGRVVEFNFKSNESVEQADVDKQELKFLYSDEHEVVFMNERTYEQVSVERELVEDKLGYLTADVACQVMFYQDKPVGVALPPNVVLEVTEAYDAVAGNRVNAPKKPVKLETGIEVQVPLFIKTHDKISVDTETGEYLMRVN